tara:strand:- start:47 stop:1117 length:1071 start_codon:yes stop_codon:yes gene_type:complete
MAISKIGRNATDTGITDSSNATAITIDSSERIGIGTTSPAQLLHLKADNPGGKIRLEMGQTGVADTDVTGEIQFYHNDASGAGVNADIKGICTNSAGAGALTFGTGTTSTTERMRISSEGKLSVTMTSTNTNVESDIGAVHILKNTSSTNNTGSMLCLGSNSNFGTGIYGQLINSSTNEHKFGIQVRNSSGSSGTRFSISGAGTTTFISSSHGNGEINFYNNAMYVKSNTGEVYATDSAGNHTQLSPHNFKYIPDGKSETSAWSYLSEKTTPKKETVTEYNSDGTSKEKEIEKIERKDSDSFTYVNVDMMKVVREVEKLTGTKLVYTGTDGKDDGSTVKDDIIAGLIKRIEVLESK